MGSPFRPSGWNAASWCEVRANPDSTPFAVTNVRRIHCGIVKVLGSDNSSMRYANDLHVGW